MATDVDLPDQKVGDTWARGGGTFGPCTFTNESDGSSAPVPFTANSCRLQFRRNGRLVYEMSNTLTGNQKITIVDANTWHFTFPQQVLPLKVGDHTWEFEVTGVDPEDVITPYSGNIKMTGDLCV